MIESQAGSRQSCRLRIGYITPRISNQRGLAIWRGMVEAAQRRNVDLLCFPGGEAQHPEDSRTPIGSHSARNAIYDLVDRASLDGLVV